MQFTHTLYKLLFLEIICLANLPVFIPKSYSSIRVIYHLLISDHFKFKDEQVRRKYPPASADLFRICCTSCQLYLCCAGTVLTQSAVSRQIQQLEEYLGTALFTRTRHGVELNHAGQQYLKYHSASQRTGTVNTRRHYASRPRRYFKTGRSAYVCDSLAIT